MIGDYTHNSLSSCLKATVENPRGMGEKLSLKGKSQGTVLASEGLLNEHILADLGNGRGFFTNTVETD